MIYSRTKIFLSVLILIFVSIICINGCTSKSPHAKNVKVIRVGCWGTPDELKIIQDAIDNWQKDHPTIFVKIQHTNYSDYISKILTRIAGGTPPDVIFTEVDMFANFYDKNAFMDLTPFIDNDKDFDIDGFFPEVVARFTKKGKIYCIPRDTAPFACVFYNKDLFDLEKVEYPNDDWNWYDLLHKAKKLTKVENGRTVQYGFYTWAWQNFIYSNGGSLVDNIDNPTKCTLDDPKSLAGLRFNVELINKYKVSPSQTALANLGTQVVQMFMAGKIAMFASGIWEVPMLRKITTFDWDVAMFPMGPTGIRGFGTGGSGYSILKTCKNPAAAWEVVKALSGSYGQIRFADAGLAQPANMKIAEGPHWALSPKLPKNKKMLNEAVQYVTYNPFNPNWRMATDLYINPELDLVFSGKETPKEAMKKIIPKINKILKKR
ncbi:MAG: sugar ABC transporter substrate-binding protein [Candidatus Ancaeobacter aquaticus]|nr:sugar ABC transporter substrate-binding protein [Candidatus Ancaeobacter aquaticus]